MKKKMSKSQKTKISTYLKITTFKNLSPNLKKKKKSTVFCFMPQLRVEPTKNSSLTGKKQLPTQQITTAERLKHKCRNSKNNCRTIKKQLPRPKTTAEMSKDNCWTSKTQLPNSRAVGQLKIDLLCASGCTKQLPQSQKTTAERSKNNCRASKTQLQNYQNKTAKMSKNNCRKVKRQLPNYQQTIAEELSS